MPINWSMTKTNEYYQDRPDLTAPLSDYLQAPGDHGTSVQKQYDASFSWTLSAGLDVPFDWFSANLGGSYSATFTNSTTYSLPLLPGEKARMVYTPQFHVVEGRFTKTEGGDIIPNPTGNSVPTPVVTDYSDMPGTASFPNPDGGTYHLRFQHPTFYTDSMFQGQATTFMAGNWDWGSFPNDAISSLRVPDGYSVVVYTDTHFAGTERAFGPGDYNYVGDQWNDQISSIAIQAAPGVP